MAPLSRLFLGPGMWTHMTIFKKVMTKTDLTYAYKPAGDMRSAGDPSPAIDDFKNYMGDIWFCFRHNFFENYPQDLKLV